MKLYTEPQRSRTCLGLRGQPYLTGAVPSQAHSRPLLVVLEVTATPPPRLWFGGRRYCYLKRKTSVI